MGVSPLADEFIVLGEIRELAPEGTLEPQYPLCNEDGQRTKTQEQPRQQINLAF